MPEKAVTASRNRLQQFPVRLSNRRDVDLERVLLDDGGRPHTTHEVVLGDQLAREPNENLHNRERPSSDWNRGTMSPQLAPTKID